MLLDRQNQKSMFARGGSWRKARKAENALETAWERDSILRTILTTADCRGAMTLRWKAKREALLAEDRPAGRTALPGPAILPGEQFLWRRILRRGRKLLWRRFCLWKRLGSFYRGVDGSEAFLRHQRFWPETNAYASKTASTAPSFGKAFTVQKAERLDYGEGDRVRHMKFGEGTVTAIADGGKDYEVTVDFDRAGVKKMFASFAKLKKV